MLSNTVRVPTHFCCLRHDSSRLIIKGVSGGKEERLGEVTVSEVTRPGSVCIHVRLGTLTH